MATFSLVEEISPPDDHSFGMLRRLWIDGHPLVGQGFEQQVIIVSPAVFFFAAYWTTVGEFFEGTVFNGFDQFRVGFFQAPELGIVMAPDKKSAVLGPGF